MFGSCFRIRSLNAYHPSSLAAGRKTIPPTERQTDSGKMPHSPDDEKFFRHLNLMPKLPFPNEANDPKTFTHCDLDLVHWLITRKRNYERANKKKCSLLFFLFLIRPHDDALCFFLHFAKYVPKGGEEQRHRRPLGSSVTCVRRRNMPTDNRISFFLSNTWLIFCELSCVNSPLAPRLARRRIHAT